MENSSAPSRAPQPGPHQQGNLIRVEQVRKLPNLTEEQKPQYEQMIKRLWDVINTKPAGSEEHNHAYQRLSTISQNLMAQMKKYQLARQQQAAQAAQMAQAQTGQPRPAVAGASNVSFHQLTPEIQRRVNDQKFFYPPAMLEGTKSAEEWLREAKARFGHALQRSEIAKQKKLEFQRQAESRNQVGNPLTQPEQDVFMSKVSQCNKAISESESFMQKFKEQQASFQAQTQHRFSKASAGSVAEAAEGPVAPNATPTNAPGATAHSISSAISAARSQAAASQGSPPPAPPQLANSSTPTHLNGPAMNPSPYHQQPPQADMMSGLNRPLPQAAQSHTQPPSTTHAHPPGYPTPAKKEDRGPISKNIQVQPPQPVELPHSRPTLTGGPNIGMAGQMAQPALASYPGYILESSEDGRVLSKKKLRELVREVCGPGADEQLTPDVELIFLEICDDFVDDLLARACKLAKARNAQQLEVRDVQMVLERTYNIRIPGYSTDEVRTVRRPQPAPGWTQKMAAVQAAKLTGGGTSSAGASKDN